MSDRPLSAARYCGAKTAVCLPGQGRFIADLILTRLLSKSGAPGAVRLAHPNPPCDPRQPKVRIDYQNEAGCPQQRGEPVVLVTAYNARVDIAEALESGLCQRFRSFEKKHTVKRTYLKTPILPRRRVHG
jgi:hypothetical protein